MSVNIGMKRLEKKISPVTAQVHRWQRILPDNVTTRGNLVRSFPSIFATALPRMGVLAIPRLVSIVFCLYIFAAQGCLGSF